MDESSITLLRSRLNAYFDNHPLSSFWEKIKTNKVHIVVILVCGALGIGLNILQNRLFAPRQVVAALPQSRVQATITSPTIYVYIAGSVHSPGVYPLPDGARLYQALDAAGGLTDTAQRDFIERNINLAAQLKDTDKVYFPSIAEVTQGIYVENSKQILHVTEVSPSSSSDPANQNVTELISLNDGTQQQIESLSGVGPITAQRIIAARPYTQIEDLVGRGIVKQAFFDKIKAQIRL